jgi:site-specific recombinase XerC
MKNKAYRASPVGEAVGRYLNELGFAGLAKNTLDAYEQVLAWLAVAHDDLPGVDEFCRPGGTDLLTEFLHGNWGSAAETTRAHRWTVLNVFFKWCLENNMLPFNPVTRIRRPKAPKMRKERQAYKQEMVTRLIDSQTSQRDRCALGLLRLALRKNDLRMLLLGEIDVENDVLHLNHAKGSKVHTLPIVFDDLSRELAQYLLDRTLEAGRDPADEYLLYPKTDRRRPLDPSSVHRWFKGCLERADLPTSIQMHELRHTALDNIWRQTGNIVLAQQLARHESPATTAGYLHPNADDLRAGLKAVEKAWRVAELDDESCKD